MIHIATIPPLRLLASNGSSLAHRQSLRERVAITDNCGSYANTGTQSELQSIAASRFALIVADLTRVAAMPEKRGLMAQTLLESLCN
jgi:hypothetical protein